MWVAWWASPNDDASMRGMEISEALTKRSISSEANAVRDGLTAPLQRVKARLVGVENLAVAMDNPALDYIYIILNLAEKDELQKLLKRSLSQKKYNNSVLGGLLQKLQTYGTTSAALQGPEHTRNEREKGRPYPSPGGSKEKGLRKGKGTGGGQGGGKSAGGRNCGGEGPGGNATQLGGSSANWNYVQGTVNLASAHLASFIQGDASQDSPYIPGALCSLLYDINIQGEPQASESLKVLVHRVQFSEGQNIKACFMLLVDHLRLAALVQSIGHVSDVYKEVACWADTPAERTFYEWCAESNRIAALSGGGMRGAVSDMTGDVAHTIANTLRAPGEGHPIGNIVRTVIVPAIVGLHHIAPFNLSALLPIMFLQKWHLPSEVDAGDLGASDRVFDCFQLSYVVIAGL
ncbi:hypothetical protein NEOLEDRAFT_1150403 [Neolentinus lepideus HHB14362 ss-1]|uniref:Uncharacterized protein n=1 Tax=Neolentinus lepideus HHB14362 ss-1 TaxID=1314782 RepID=A0A165Q675_9AGAM|nr:hypothetical protein NEOLEDRAFT_1150403 [Neolentinus lepideus HHB14362 ss-1]